MDTTGRARILEAARGLVAERGFADVSLADIGKVAGVSRTTVAYHFHPRERLIAELLRGPREGMATLMAGTATGADFARAYVQFVVSQRDYLGLVFLDPSLVRHPIFGPPLRSAREGVVTRLSAGDTSDAARVRGWALMGAINIAILQTTDVDSELVIETVTALANSLLETS